MSEKVIVTGGAGFIASHLQRCLVRKGYDVTSVDIRPFSQCPVADELSSSDRFAYIQMDVNDVERFIDVSKDADIIFHMASNTDIRRGSSNPDIDYDCTFGTTHSVLEAMRRNGIGKMFFSSSSAVYGKREGLLREDMGDLKPLSYYGAYKLACESMISSYSYMNGFDAVIFRSPNVIGPGITHGVIYDLISKLKKDGSKLEILGNGRQSKQYLYIDDLVKGIVDFSSNMGVGVNTFNVSNDSSVDVDSIAKMVCQRMDLEPKFMYTGGEAGWKGDVPSFTFDITKAKSKGWKYSLDSKGAVMETLSKIDLDAIPAYGL